MFNNRSVVSLAFVLALGFTSPIALFAAGPAIVNLGTSGNFVILAKTGVSTTGSTLVTGDIGVSPAAASYITGFALSLPASSASSTSALVTGRVYAPGYADPTSAQLTTSVNDMQAAYTDAAGRTNPTATELGAGNIGGMTLAPGLYKWSTGVTIPSDVTLSGSASDVWIFQIAQNLNISSAKKIILAGGAQASNIFWVVAGQTTIGTTAVFNGNILDQTAIVLNTGAILNGRALAQAAVTLDSSTVTVPTFTPPTPPTPTIMVSCDPLPVGFTATVVNNACVYTSTTPAVPATTSTPTPSSSRGQAITLGNGQTVYVDSNGVFVDANGNSVSNSTISNTTTAAPSVSSFGQEVRALAVNLQEKSKGDSVTALQQFLISQNKGSSAQALASAGATGYFGSLTRSALAEFQASVGISPALGNFGSITRAYLSTNY